MANETSSSSGAGATPATGSPATGTATGSATPPAATLSLEEAMKRIAELETHAQNKTEEASRHGSKLTAAEKELAAYKEKERLAQEASLSEQEKLQKKVAEQEAIHEGFVEKFVDYEVRLAAAEMGINPKYLSYVARAIDWDELEFDQESGLPTNIKAVLDKLLKEVPVLKETPQGAPAQQQKPAAPTVPAMNPGRTSIAAPGSSSGKRPSWADVQWSG